MGISMTGFVATSGLMGATGSAGRLGTGGDFFSHQLNADLLPGFPRAGTFQPHVRLRLGGIPDAP